MAEAAMVAAAADADDDSFQATAALVAYLRMEADLSQEKARRLRQQAAALAQSFGVTDAAQEAYELDPGEMPPLDENGVPKYKGKKRGRKPKPRKRKANPNRRKRQHTGYTLYMQEHYPTIKEENPDFVSKDIIALIGKQWSEVTPEEKAEWKARAIATHSTNEEEGETEAAAEAAAAAVEDVVDEEEDEEEIEDDDEPAPPARRRRKQKK